MTLLLAGDIGGTKTILNLVEATTSGNKAGTALQPLYESRYSSADFPDLVPMVRKFLTEAAPQLGTTPLPAKACFAIAGPVVDGASKLTNLSWSLETHRLSQALEIPQVSLINDFAAVGYGVLGLEDTDLHTLQPGTPHADAPIAIIGAGTGLGEGFIIHQAGTYRVYGSEGGHADFAPRTALEFQLLRYLIERHGLERVSTERVVSGQGIVSIYQFLRDRGIAQESPEIAHAIQIWQQEMGKSEKTVDPGAVIGKAALDRQDPLSEQTLQMFVELYGAEAGNLALKLLPYGGMYVAGGIAPKILPLLTDGRFLSAFGRKGRMSPLLERIPLHIVLNPKVGLIGAALCAASLEG
jgi:glucokinase